MLSTKLEQKQDRRHLLANTLLLPLTHTAVSYPQTHLLVSISMSQTPPTIPSSSNFQAILYASIKEYEKKTKKDILIHPLMAQFQTCNSPTDILAILRTQVQHFEQSTRGDDKLTRWLDPTVNVLYAFSATLSAGVGLVSSILAIFLQSNFRYRFSRYSHPRMSFSLVLVSSFRYLTSWITITRAVLILHPYRRQKTLLRVKMRSSISSSVLRTSSDGSRHIPRCRRRRR